ncbi:30S ribosomal protein S19 [Candidatus Micrarchaeota archaeon CG_4_10_14_0_2_um_filter_60_11]|nr:MAG: 30S ribosomal protein S19 [Candidatus Micrarchaeota archaeon CG1_02_60_51]PIN96494.1 MAG: 30S ribosomal protein S19 [Candidatus Micrarchaeota archaeon CG10_big_fil_rev_8_21_14_0_10_60_32]PIO01866.1 MAG: 30S ribosomal protein S19 [Candidatus Micrarchaeota archaeon CG09_land_8_20_14_0_10_60_16]PIY91532.1 MAG: 30S ribosomal protein S19 [Candidatus Micrarchaeota archaeon CG_4_10_14_0_8_um_filter_60_7]PIZ90853.1 MAG: 30S ribosomal protein S19 [Candidatus Micrarchaeota archaeon CG_4_10_14_0_2
MATRKFSYKGKTLEELQALSVDEFVKLVPSRQRRSLGRMGHSFKAFIRKLRKHDRKKPFRTHIREMIVLPEMVGLQMETYNGKEWVKCGVIPEMLGRRLGEYSHTCKLVKHSGPGIGATRGSKAVELK